MLFGSLATLFALLSLISPSRFYTCSSFPGGGGVCSSYEQVLVLLLSIPIVLGIGLLFFAIFGRGVVLGSFFILGVISLAWGAIGLSFGELSIEMCQSSFCPLGSAFDATPYWILIAVGATMISSQIAVQKWKKNMMTVVR
jgi:hypothetical protein